MLCNLTCHGVNLQSPGLQLASTWIMAQAPGQASGHSWELVLSYLVFLARVHETNESRFSPSCGMGSPRVRTPIALPFISHLPSAANTNAVKDTAVGASVTSNFVGNRAVRKPASAAA